MHQEIRVDAGGLLTVLPFKSSIRTNGAHGGDNSSFSGYGNEAHGDFRNPRFPGASGYGWRYRYSSSTYYKNNGAATGGGGVLLLTSPLVTINGTFSADGESTTNSTTACPYPTWCADGAGAGGTVNITTQQINGSGTVQPMAVMPPLPTRRRGPADVLLFTIHLW